MAVTSNFILYTGSTAIDLRKVSSYVIDPNVANQVLIRMQDENRTTIAMNQTTFEAAYQAALNSVATFGSGFADPSFTNTNGTFTPSSTGAIGTIGANVSTVVIAPTGTLATASIIAPASPSNGFELTIIFAVNAVTSFTLTANTGQTVLAGAGVSGAANSSLSWQFTTAAIGGTVAANTWMRLR